MQVVPPPKLSQSLLLISRKGSYCFQHVSILLSHIDMRSSDTDNSVHTCSQPAQNKNCSLLGSETENGQGGGLIKMANLYGTMVQSLRDFQKKADTPSLPLAVITQHHFWAAPPPLK